MRWLVPCLAALTVAATAAAQAQAPAPGAKAAVVESARDGETAMPGRWYVDGGNAAHNASTGNPALLRRPLLAWQVPAGGTILGEPLVWDRHVVIALRISDKRRGIEVRRLEDGSLVGQRALDSTIDPSPTIWGNDIVWRVPDGLELLRIGAKGVELVTRMPKAKVVGPPVRLGTRVYAAVDGSVTCMRASDFRVIWRSSGRDFVGPLAIAGDVVCAAVSSAVQFRLVTLDRRTGEPLGSCDEFRLTKAVDGELQLQLAGAELLVRLGTGNLFADFSAAKFQLNGLSLRLPLLATGKLVPCSVPMMRALDRRWHVGLYATPQGQQLGLFAAGEDNGMRLDTCELHRELAKVPPTLAGEVMYFGACAVDITSRRILWRLARDGDQPLPKSRAIPAGRTLLLADERRLLALREDAPPDPITAELHGVWLTGLRDRLVKLVDDAIATADWDLAGDLLGRCRELEANEDWATKRERDLAAKSQDKKAKVDAGKASLVRTNAEAAGARALDDVHRSLAAWSERPPLDRRQALRFVLNRDAGHAGAAAEVRGLLPADVTPPEPFRAADWLDFLDAAAHTKVAFLDVKAGELTADGLDPIVAQCKQQLLEWRSRWRPDLQALQSPRLLLFSPIATPGSLARSLATGELVCDLLESMFAEQPRVRQDLRPMMVFIYADKQEYLRESKKLGVEDVDWTAGYYSDMLQETFAKSRLYVPSDDVGFATVLPTLAHELTHHWLNDRCQAFVPDPVAPRVGAKAFWIVEGFASLVEQFEFDFARRTFRLAGGDLERADVVASASASQLLDWDGLVRMSRLEFARLTRDRREVDVPSSLRLGESFRTRRVSLFYAQSAMLARYLYEAEGGKHKKALLDYVAAYYTGRQQDLDFAKAFGVAAKELGPKVAAHAKALVQ